MGFVQLKLKYFFNYIKFYLTPYSRYEVFFGPPKPYKIHLCPKCHRHMKRHYTGGDCVHCLGCQLTIDLWYNKPEFIWSDVPPKVLQSITLEFNMKKTEPKLYIVFETWCYGSEEWTPNVAAAVPRIIYFSLDRATARKETARLNRLATKAGDGIDGGKEYSYSYCQQVLDSSTAIYDFVDAWNCGAKF